MTACPRIETRPDDTSAPPLASWAWVLLRQAADRLGRGVGLARFAAAAAGDALLRSAGGPTPSRRPEFDEGALLAAAQGGSLPAFNQLVLHYQSLAYNVAYRIMGDGDSASDATQDGFIKAFQRLGQYRGGSFKAWLLRIITNTCYDALRANRRRPTTSLDRDEDDDLDAEHDGRLLDPAEQPDAAVLRSELAETLSAAILRLPPDQRITLVLSDIEGLDYNEIAIATGAALGTVKSRLSRARARVRDILLAHKELLPGQYRLA